MNNEQSATLGTAAIGFTIFLAILGEKEPSTLTNVAGAIIIASLPILIALHSTEDDEKVKERPNKIMKFLMELGYHFPLFGILIGGALYLFQKSIIILTGFLIGMILLFAFISLWIKIYNKHIWRPEDATVVNDDQNTPPSTEEN